MEGALRVSAERTREFGSGCGFFGLRDGIGDSNESSDEERPGNVGAAELLVEFVGGPVERSGVLRT